MLAVTLPGLNRAELIEIPRPTLRDPGDAIVLVTTTAIGPWDVARFVGDNTENTGGIPGGEFAGIVVETGEDVSLIDIDDLVANTVEHTEGGEIFGSSTLPGGHAEYVRVPSADSTLTRIAVSGEERAVLAGGTAGLGAQVATTAISVAPKGTYTVVGCDPIGITALIALKQAGAINRSFAIENHPARKTLATNMASRVYERFSGENPHQTDVVIVGAISEGPGIEAAINSVKPGGHIIFAEPYGLSALCEHGIKFPDDVTHTSAHWPNVNEARQIVTNLQIRRLDLTPLVSHVMPLAEVQDAYEAAAGPGPGVHKVLLKP